MGKDAKNETLIKQQVFSKLVASQLKTKYSPKLSFVDFSFSQAEKINSLINTK